MPNKQYPHIIDMSFFLLVIIILGLRIPNALAQETPWQIQNVAGNSSVTLNAPWPDTEGIDHAGISYVRLLPPAGSDLLNKPTYPALPVYTFLLALPPSGQLDVSWQGEATITKTLAGHWLPAASVAPEQRDGLLDPLASPVNHQYPSVKTSWADPAPISYPYPKQIVSWQEIGTLRGQRLARLIIYPYQLVGPDKVRYAPHIVVNIRAPATRINAMDGSNGNDPIAQLLRQQVLNPDGVTPFFAATSARATNAASLTPANLPGSFKIIVAADGIYQLTYQTLVAAGFPVSGSDPAHWHLWHAGQELAIQINDGGDGHFDPGDTLWFYGQKRRSRYGDENTYWLTADDRPGKRIASENGNPVQGGQPLADTAACLHLEEDHIYRSNMPWQEGADHWFWTYYSQGRMINHPTRWFTGTLPAPVLAGDATLTVAMQGASSYAVIAPDHHATFQINGTPVGDAYWDGRTPYTFTTTFPAQLLHTGENSIRLHAPGNIVAGEDSAYINWLTLCYHRQFVAAENILPLTWPDQARHLLQLSGFSTSSIHLWRIEDPANIRDVANGNVTLAGDHYRLTVSLQAAANTHYLAWSEAALRAPLRLEADSASQWRQYNQHADYILITHPDFLNAARRLASFWRANGLAVVVVSVQDIYDEYNGGNLSPDAIHNFLADAYHHWPGSPPLYVTLLGDGTYDFRDVLHSGSKNFIPPMLRLVDPFIGETATDNRYVTVDGNDPLPDMLIGRLPADTPQDADAMVSKIIAYQTAPPPGDWQNRLFFVSDNPDGAGDFYQLSDAAAALVPDSYQVQKMYLGREQTDVLAARQAVRDGIDRGDLIVNFVGHGAIPWWAAEILFSTDDVPHMSNGGRLPVFMEMTCYTGYFHAPGFDSLAEVLVRRANGGAVADWAASGLGIAHGHDYLDRGFFDALFRDGKQGIGVDTLAGKLRLYRTPSAAPFYDLIDTYILFGDPALQIHAQTNDLSVTMQGDSQTTGNGAVVTYTLTYGNTGPAVAAGATLTLTLTGGWQDVQWQSSTPVTYTQSAPDVWHLGNLPAGSRRQLIVWGNTNGGEIHAQATVSSNGKDINLSNNQDSLTITTVQEIADLAVQWQNWSSTPILPRQPRTFVLRYRNNGPGLAHDLRMTLALPTPLTILSVASAPQLWHQEASSWHLTSLRAGATGFMTFTVQSRDSGLSLPYNASAQAFLHASNDPQPANNISRLVSMDFLWPDIYEPDNTPKRATFLQPGALSARHTIHAVNDVDWFSFIGHAGMFYRISVKNLETGGDTILQLYDQSLRLLVKNNNAAPGDAASLIRWRAPEGGLYYVKVSGLGEQPGWHYGLSIVAGHTAYVPAILFSVGPVTTRPCTLRTAGTFPVGATPQKLAIGARSLYVALGEAHPMLVNLDRQSGIERWQRPLAVPAIDLVAHQGQVYLSQRLSGQISVYDNNGAKMATWPLSGMPWGISWQNGALWSNNYARGQLERLDPHDGSQTGHWALAGKPTWLINGTQTLYLPLLAGQVETYRTKDNAVAPVAFTPGGTFSLAVDEPGHRLFIGNVRQQTVTMLNLQTGQQQRLAQDIWPSALQLSPDRHWLFVLDGLANRLLLFDTRTNRLTAQIATPPQGTRWGDLLLDAANSTLWQTNYAAGSVSRYRLAGCGE